MGRYGLIAAAIAGILVAVAPFIGDAASGPARGEGGGDVNFEFGDANTVSLVIIGLVAFAVVGGTALSTRLWVNFAGVVLASAAAVIYARSASLARSDPIFEDGASTTLETGGILLATAYVISLIGIVIALTQTRLIPPDPRLVAKKNDGEESDMSQERSATATSGLVLSIVGLILPLFGAAAGTMVSAVALSDIGASGQKGRMFALIGLAIGAALFTVFATVGIVQVLTAEPT